jgi:hypothetical protein
VPVRVDRKATSIVLLVVLGVREDGQKVLLAVKNMGGRDQRGVARGSRLSRQALATQTRVPDCRQRDWAGTGPNCPLGRRADPTLHGPQAPQPARPRAQRLHEEVSADYRFASESACAENLFKRRWPEGFACPGCGNGRAWQSGIMLLRINNCRRPLTCYAKDIGRFLGSRRSQRTKCRRGLLPAPALLRVPEKTLRPAWARQRSHEITEAIGELMEPKANCNCGGEGSA